MKISHSGSNAKLLLQLIERATTTWTAESNQTAFVDVAVVGAIGDPPSTGIKSMKGSLELDRNPSAVDDPPLVVMTLWSDNNKDSFVRLASPLMLSEVGYRGEIQDVLGFAASRFDQLWARMERYGSASVARSQTLASSIPADANSQIAQLVNGITHQITEGIPATRLLLSHVEELNELLDEGAVSKDGDSRTAVSAVSVMIREAESVHSALCSVIEHSKLEAMLDTAVRQLDLKDEQLRDKDDVIETLASSNASLVKIVASGTLPNLINAAKGVVAVNEPTMLVDRSRRGFLAAIGTLSATGLISAGISRYDTDRAIDASTSDTDRIVASVDRVAEGYKNNERTIQDLTAELEEAVASLQAACGEGISQTSQVPFVGDVAS